MKFKILLFLALSCNAIGCAFQSASTPQIQNDTTEQTQIDLTPPQISDVKVNFPDNSAAMPKALDVSTQPKDVELSQKIVETIEKSAFKNARWGIFVTSLKDGRVLVAQDAQKSFNPASTQKLLTTAVALDKLGPDFQWRTSVLSANQIGADGTLGGDLILYGRGAPDFDEKGMANLVEQLKQKGLKRVNGNIIGDASYFHADNLGSGWVWDEAQWYYGAEPSALSYSDNTVLVEIVPNNAADDSVTIRTVPEAAFAVISNSAKTAANATVGTVGVHRDLDANNFQIWGEVPRGKSFGVRTTMHAPQLWAADALKKALTRGGIAVTGDIKSRDWRTTENADISGLKELGTVVSETLAEIAKRTNKRSINLNAELILRALGQKMRENNPRHLIIGDDELGAQAIKSWLAEKGVEIGETEIHDGSGLSRLDFISPETMGRLLVHAARMPNAQAFKDSLPIAGTDGTLGGRLPKFKDKVFAKTGTVTFVNALAGYAQISDDETVAFTIICNNETSKQNSVATIDAIASLIAGSAGKNQSSETQ